VTLNDDNVESENVDEEDEKDDNSYTRFAIAAVA
jgi:hypothetical protein